MRRIYEKTWAARKETAGWKRKTEDTDKFRIKWVILNDHMINYGIFLREAGKQIQYYGFPLQYVWVSCGRITENQEAHSFHISPVLSRLHWLSLKHCIHFKVLLITYKALNVLAPQYLSKLLSHYSLSRSLRPQDSGQLRIPN